MARCARCGSSEHATAGCPLPFYKTFCNTSPQVRKAEYEKRKAERKEKQDEYEKNKSWEREVREAGIEASKKLNKEVQELLRTQKPARREIGGTWQWRGRGDRRDSDAKSESAASSVSTAPTESWPRQLPPGSAPSKRTIKRALQRGGGGSSLVVAVVEASPTPDPAPAPAPTSPAAPTPDPAPVSAPTSPAPAPSAEVLTKPKGQLLSNMIETIRGELGLDDSLNMAQVIAEANSQLAVTAEGNLAEQARTLLREIIPA